MTSPPSPRLANGLAGLWLVAAWTGLFVGLMEGALLLGLQHAGLATWTMIRDGVDARILIVSPVFNLALFTLFGAIWAAPVALARRHNLLPWAVGFLAWAGFYDLLACTGRLNELASTLLGLGLATQAALQYRRDPAGVMRFMRRSLPVLVVVALLAAAGVGAGRILHREPASVSTRDMLLAPPRKMPNVLLVVLDTVRADHLGAYGYARATSPRFDYFARNGVLFENAFSSSSWTLPSHASLFTNLYNFRNRVDPWFLDQQFLTLAEFLRDHRFDTAGFVGNTYWCNHGTGMAQGFQHHADYFHNLPDAIHRTLFGRKAMEAVLQLFGYYRNPAKKTADRVNEEFFAWLDARPGPPRQFFVFLNYYDPHEPVFPPAPYDARFAPAEVINRRKPLDTHKALPDPVPQDRLQADLDAYDSTIAFVDAQLGELWAQLEKRGVAENTLLILTSDHGHSFGEGGVYGHRTSLRREQIHVPLVLYRPGRIPAGVRVPAPVSNIHVPATVLDLFEFPAAFDGHSLAPLWRDPAAATQWNEPVLAELARPRRDVPQQWPVARGDMKTLVTDRWQYLEAADGTAQLFDWRVDPREERDLAQSEEGRAVAAALRARLQQMLAGKPAAPPRESGPE